MSKVPDPTEKQIAEEAAKIRANWSDQVEKQRRVIPPESWHVPVARTPEGIEPDDRPPAKKSRGR